MDRSAWDSVTPCPAQTFNRMPQPPLFNGNGGGTKPIQFPAKPYNLQELYAQEQRRYSGQPQSMSNPTRFDAQLQDLPVGGRAKCHHIPYFGNEPRATHRPQDLDSMMPNNPTMFSGPRCFATAPVSNDVLSRMMRPVDEVDPALVTNPIPDPTFVARQPMFNHAPEEAELERLRLQRNGPNRFF